MAFTPATLQEWNYKLNHVQPDSMVGPTGGAGNFISSESIVLAAGPPIAPGGPNSTIGVGDLIPIGVCETIQIAQNKNIMQLYEIGSRKPYFIPGRPITQVQLNRISFNGDSLLAAVTRLINDGEYDPTLYPAGDMPGAIVNSPSGSNAEGRFFMNLASTFFNNPFGLGIFYKDSENEWVAGFYLENCYIQNHQMTLQGQNIIVMENALVRTAGMLTLETLPAA